MSIVNTIGKDKYDSILKEIEPIVKNFNKLPEGQKLKEATKVFTTLKAYEMGAEIIIDDLGGVLIENDNLKEKITELSNYIKKIKTLDEEEFNKLFNTTVYTKENDKRDAAIRFYKKKWKSIK